MGGKSWAPWMEVVVTPTAGQHWASRFPRLSLWESYRAGTPANRPYGVAVTNKADGAAFVVRPDGDRWVMIAVETADTGGGG